MRISRPYLSVPTLLRDLLFDGMYMPRKPGKWQSKVVDPRNDRATTMIDRLEPLGRCQHTCISTAVIRVFLVLEGLASWCPIWRQVLHSLIAIRGPPLAELGATAILETAHMRSGMVP